MPDIAILRFGYEGNSFAPVMATLDDYKGYEWFKGEEAPAFYRGTSTELGGAVAFFDGRDDWTPHYLRCAWTTPSGEMERETFETITAEIIEDLGSRKWDAVYLSQHGAMQVVGIEHADHELLRRIREVIGETPLGASYDLHANITQELIDLCDVTVGYKCHPHTDMVETAQKTLRLLIDLPTGEPRPVGVVHRMNAMLPSINARTTDGPMAEVAAFARGLELGAGLYDLTVYQGYAFGDRAHSGGSVVAYARDKATAAAAAAAAAAEVVRVRDRLFIDMPSGDAGMARALQQVRQGNGPVAVIDPADFPGSGASADTPGLLKAVLDANVDVPTAVLFYWDPGVVAKAVAAGVGSPVEVDLGGRLTDAFGPPVPFKGRVARVTDGRIVHTGPFCNGQHLDYGPTVVLESGNVQVVVTSKCLHVTDPAFFDLHGIDLDRVSIVAIKAKNQFRAAFRPLFKEMIDVDIPGPAPFDIRILPFRKLPMTHYPFTGGPPQKTER
jgi:microcystin degradation protein MlrC